MGKAARVIDGEIAVVHLVEDEIPGGNVGTLVVVPAMRIGLVHVNDSTALAVHAHGGCPDTWALAAELAAILHVEGVELALQVTLDFGLPPILARVVRIQFHVDRLDGFATLTIFIDAQLHLLGVAVGLDAEVGSIRAIQCPGVGFGIL